MLLDFIINNIYFESVEYAEIKFFKNICHRLKVADKVILEQYPNVEYWLEGDINVGKEIEKLTNQFLEIAKMSKFDLIITKVETATMPKHTSSKSQSFYY